MKNCFENRKNHQQEWLRYSS